MRDETGDAGQDMRDETTPNEQKQRRKWGLFRLSHIVPHRLGASRRSKAGNSGQVPTLHPERLISPPFSTDRAGTLKFSTKVP